VDLVRIAAALEHPRVSSPDNLLTTTKVRQIIERRFGVVYCASSARAILHRLGFSYTRKLGWHRAGERHGESRRRAS
jgi:transposase